MADQSLLPRRIVKETQRLLTEPGAWWQHAQWVSQARPTPLPEAGAVQQVQLAFPA